MNYVEPIRDRETVMNIANFLSRKSQKYYIMYMIGIYSGLRISDILKLRVRDVRGKSDIRLREQKTGKEKLFPVNNELAAALKVYCCGKRDSDYIVPSPVTGRAISREYAYRVIHRAGLEYGLEHLGTHTMRKTFGYHFYMQTKDIVLLMRIFNHSDQSKTLRYIGVEQSTINDALKRFSY